VSDLADQVIIGKITTVYGVKGWVKVHAYTDPIDNFLHYQDCQIQQNGQWQAIRFDAGRRHGKGLVVHIQGIDDRDTAAAFCQSEIAIDGSLLPPLQSGDYYWHELEGLHVMATDECGQDLLLGQVSHCLETGANDVLVVRSCHGSLDKQERLIPYVPGQYVIEVDTQKGVIRVDWDPDF